MDSEKQSQKKQNHFLLLLFVVVVPAITVVGFLIYLKLTPKPDQFKASELSVSQESFSGSPQISEQLQSECQRSAEKLAATAPSSVAQAAAEYSAYVEKCREVSFALPENSDFRSEGNYPDLIVDLARVLFKTEPAQAIQLLTEAKNLPPWEYVSGPLACDSSRALEAHIESMSIAQKDIKCVTSEELGESFLQTLRQGRFEVLSKIINSSDVAQLGSSEAGIGCPVPASELIALIRSLSAGAQISENKTSDNAERVLAIKAIDEDKVILEFKQINSCYYLKAVFVSGLQQND